MAKTSGQGNPDWNREETILALELFLKHSNKLPGKNHDDVINLSELLRALPYHANASKSASFRNPAGVAFKLQNIKDVATGKGMPNGSALDKELWKRYHNSEAEVVKLANIVRAAMSVEPLVSSDNVDEFDDDEEFAEGKSATRIHKKKERNRKVRKALLAKRKKANNLKCDVCGSDYAHLPNLRESAFEAHHIIPFAANGERNSKLSDFALLCAVCHRLTHRAMRDSGKWMGVTEMKVELKLV